MEIGNRMDAMMDATLTTAAATRRSRIGDTGLLGAVALALRAVRHTIVNGSERPCWRNGDGEATFALLPAREQRRLLDAGLAPSP